LGFIAPLLPFLTGGHFGPVAIEAHPREANDSSLLKLGWEVKNKTKFIDLANVRFTCGADLVYAVDATAQKYVVVRDAAYLTPPYSIDGAGVAQINCTPQNILQVRANSSLSLFGSMTELEDSFGFRAPLTFLRVCVWISAEYRLWGIIPWGSQPSDIWAMAKRRKSVSVDRGAKP
jgi:hypothetical protein